LHDGRRVLVGLLEAIIDREADRVERIQGEVDKLSQTIFETRAASVRARAASTSTSGRSGARASSPRDRGKVCSRSTGC
jgi:Mg2+ and Co2+ transporter CorA